MNTSATSCVHITAPITVIEKYEDMKYLFSYISAHRQAWSLCKMQHLFLLSYSKSHSVADFQSAGDGREKA